MRLSRQAFSAPSKQMPSSNPKGDLSSIASISASSTISTPSSELLASKPRDSTLKREQNSCYEHDNGLNPDHSLHHDIAAEQERAEGDDHHRRAGFDAAHGQHPIAGTTVSEALRPRLGADGKRRDDRHRDGGAQPHDEGRRDPRPEQSLRQREDPHQACTGAPPQSDSDDRRQAALPSARAGELVGFRRMRVPPCRPAVVAPVIMIMMMMVMVAVAMVIIMAMIMVMLHVVIVILAVMVMAVMHAVLVIYARRRRTQVAGWRTALGSSADRPCLA